MPGTGLPERFAVATEDIRYLQNRSPGACSAGLFPQAQAFAHFPHANSRPGLAVTGPAAHSIKRHGELSIRPMNVAALQCRKVRRNLSDEEANLFRGTGRLELAHLVEQSRCRLVAERLA
jgi:hypothetical protein